MSLRINSEAPNFTAETTQGTINFHEWIGDGWAILFSHPKDFTPVCTTELGYMAGLQPEFAKRNTKIIGLSVDPVTSHGKWAADIEETQGHKVTYPMIGDPELKVAKLYDMLPAERGRHERWPHRRRQCHRAHRVRDWSGQEDQADADLSHEQRTQLRRSAARAGFDPAHAKFTRRHAGELEAGRGRDHSHVGVR
jgi:peroxiredoxin